MRKWILTAIGIILSLALGYLFLTGSHYSQLIGFFGYMSVACTLIPLPTPPFVIALGKVFEPSIVAFAGAIGNCIAAFVEYHLLLWLFSKTELQQRIETNSVFQRFSYYFHRAAFVCLVFTGFTPIPFEPFRFAAILIRYNLSLYLLAVLLGCFPKAFFDCPVPRSTVQRVFKVSDPLSGLVVGLICGGKQSCCIFNQLLLALRELVLAEIVSTTQFCFRTFTAECFKHNFRWGSTICPTTDLL